MFLTEDQIELRDKVNANMMELPTELEEGNLPPFCEDVLVRLFYLPVESGINESGLIEPKYKLGESDGGKIIASIDDNPYQRRGVIVKTSPKSEAEGLTVGMIVWLPLHVYQSSAYDVLYHKDHAVDNAEGFKKIPFRNIEYIEKALYA